MTQSDAQKLEVETRERERNSSVVVVDNEDRDSGTQFWIQIDPKRARPEQWLAVAITWGELTQKGAHRAAKQSTGTGGG